MKVHYDLKDLPEFRNAILTIGSFDGVHKGHQRILKLVLDLASKENGESIVVTFHPHPRIVLKKEVDKLKLLSSLSEKIFKLEKLGIDHLVVVPFDEAFANQSAEAYIEDYLKAKFQPKHLVIGYDHRFGKDRSGNLASLQEALGRDGTEVHEIPKQEVNSIAISSTKIRKALEEGKISLATELLGETYVLTGKIIRGERIGRDLGFPTANVEVDNSWKLIPKAGIYAVRARVKGKSYEGMMYIGDRPTIEHLKKRTIEVHLFDFTGEIYGEEMMVFIDQFSREDQRFENFEELKSAIALDEINIKKFYAERGQATAHIERPEVAVVILNYNGSHHLEEYLPSVRKTQYENLRIIVVDNCSTDDSAATIKEHFPHVELMLLDKNYGFTGGYAKALMVIDSPYLVLMNSDVRVEPDWLDKAMDLILEDERIAVVQPKILSDKNQEEFEYAGASGGWIDILGYPFARGRIFDSVEKDLGQYDDEQDIFWASGCAFLIRNDAYRKAGGLDPSFFAHLEEIDLCWRLQRLGYSIKVAPKSVVYHLGGGTLSYQSPRKTFLNFRNSLFMVYKNRRGLPLIGNILLRLILDGVAGIKFLLTGKFSDCLAIIKAHFSFYGHIPSLEKRKREEREWIQQGILPSPKNITGLYKGSIVFQYYILGKKFFSKLF
ncbi:MAG: riboflavin biosynthesis protein RibF [Saprospiraceae bacterium]|nr:riboflavin biosynthesis protein RibF [Saprospiraceae bacterium]